MENSKYNAFTLAETLITLGLIGVVAAMTLPTLLTNIHDSVQRRAAAIAARKFTQSLEIMQASGAIAPYKNTAEFVDALKSYLKIVRVCDTNHIKDCWSYDTVRLYDGSTYNIDQAINGSVFFMNDKDISGNDAKFEGENVAFVIMDGTSVIMNYNTECKDGDPKASANCIVALFETNGKKRPNKLGKDAILLNARHFGNESEPSASDTIACFGDRYGCVDVAIETTSKVNSKQNNLPIDYDDEQNEDVWENNPGESTGSNGVRKRDPNG